MKKRITALLLCLVMVFSLIPTSVWATESPTTDTGSGGFEEQDPNALTEEGVKEILKKSKAQVAVKCINPNGGCNVIPVNYGLTASTFTMEKNEENGYTLTVEAAPFVAAYSNSGQGRHLPHDLYSAETLTWKLSRENDAWTASPAVEGVDDTVLVTHTPEATYDVLKSLQGSIDTRCKICTTTYNQIGVIAGLVGDSAAKAQVTKGAVSGTYNLTISTENFANAIHTDKDHRWCQYGNDRNHDLLTGETANFVLSLSKNDADKYVWTATPVTAGVDNVCEVAHRVKVTFDQNYTNASAATEAMYEYGTANVKEGEFPADPVRDGYVFQGWNTKADGTGAAFSKENAVTEDMTVYAKWQEKQTVQLVIYRNGNTETAYKTVSLGKMVSGTVLTLSDYDIADYYTANNTGKYDFYGWYNDGKWNEYTKNLANPPAGLEKITVNGWTNLKCMVYDYETVAYFETAEALKAYQTDHTGGPLFTTTARKGSTLPTVDAPEATRAGYTFQYWSREGQSVDVTGQTVNGWTNLYGVWTITPHNIYAYARLNSYFAPLTATEFDDPITLNADTLKRLGLGSYNRLGYIPIGTFNFAGMPLVDDMYFDDDTLNAVADAAIDAIDNRTINLRPGVESSTAALIDWTVLYKTFNEEDMAPGYITDDGEGYQLSGNLNLATVMFRAGGDNVENMPTVNYVYDDVVEIHDFYFRGDVFDLPENVPTREGYIFKGWRAERLGDVEVMSDPTTDAGAEDEKLWQPGDSGENGYPITAQGVIFTAQWEKAEYTIASDLRLNGNETVKETGKTYAWTHRYGGKFEENISYTEMFDALEAKAREVDAANEPYSVDVKLCFPGSQDKLFNEAITYYGQKGGGWNPGVKNTAYIWGYATTSYEVIFNSDGGSAVDTQIVKYGEKAVSETPEKYGYNFAGWFIKGTDDLFDFNTEITHKTELTAHWEKKTYTIASDLRINGGDANLADGKTYAWTYRESGKFEETISYDAMFAALKARALEVDAANGPVDSVVTLCFPGSDKLFNDAVKTYGQDTANWQAANNNTAYIWGYATNVYAVTFNYGTEDIKNEILKVNFGDTITKSDPKRDGYTFTGWYTDEKCTEKFDFATPITKSMTLYAGWEIIPHDIYAYARLNSSFGQLTTSEWGDDIELNAETLERLGLVKYNDNGYISIGKFTFNAMALTDDLYFDDETTAAVLEALKKDIVLETGVSADTAAKIAWTYLYQADDSEDSDYMYKSGYPTTDKDSYQLSGNLFLAAAMFDAGDIGEDEVKNMPKVNYTFEDGLIEIHDFYLPGTEIDLPALERTGYTFLGWEMKVIPSDDVTNYADTDAEKTVVEAGKYTITDGGAIFTAQWQINTYNVTFDSNGGSAVEPQKVDYRAKVTKPAEPTREGYHFMGWFNGDKEWNFDEDTMGAADMTLTAKWEINEYTVSFDSKGGTKVDSQIVKHGDTADKPSNPRRNGYVFKGWYLDGQKFDFSTPITGDTTLTARWATKTSGGSNSSSDTTTKDNGKTVKSGKTFDGGIALYVGLSVLSATGSALVITKKKRG